jgi:hypothetical protein
MQRENLLDAGQIVKTILTQPLSVPDASQDISLLSAALNFDKQDASSSDLSKILHQFLAYPEPTHSLLIELQIISEDLRRK